MNNVEKMNVVRIVPDKLVGLAFPQARLVEKHRLWDGLTLRGEGCLGVVEVVGEGEEDGELVPIY